MYQYLVFCPEYVKRGVKWVMYRRDKMLRKVFALLLLSAVFLASGCGGSVSLRNPSSPSHSLLYGHLNTATSGTGNCWLSIREISSGKRGKRYMAECDEMGYFWASNIPPGKYHIEKFGNHMKVFNDEGYMRVIKNMREFRESTRMTIRKPGIYYMGTFRVTTGGSGSFGSGSQKVVRAERPDERKVLRRLLQVAAGTDWDERINRRMRSLKGN